MPAARILTWALGGLTAVAMLPGLVALAVAPELRAGVEVAVGVLLAAVAAGAAVLVSRHAPANAVGPILMLGAFVAVFDTSMTGYAIVAGAGELPAPLWFVAAREGSWMLLYVPMALLLLHFPDGRLPSRRWRVVPIALLVVISVFFVVAALIPWPYPAPFEDRQHPEVEWMAAALFVVLPAFMATLIASLASAVVRYRRSGEVARRQLRMLALAGISLPLTLLVCWLSYLVLDGPDLVVIGLLFMFLAFPIAAAVAVIRHDLYDVDRALVLTTVYGIIGAGLLLVFTVVSAVTGLALAGGSTVLAVIATAASALALGTLRPRLVDSVGRRLYPARARALAAIEDLRTRVHRGEAVPEQLEPVLRRALADPELRIGYVVPGGEGFRDRDGRPVPSGPGAQTITVGDEVVGVLVAAASAAPWLMRDVAEASGLVVEIARLRLELAQALRDVEASRSRLLRAGYEERKRLELDLHDGAQQRLVSLGMSLRLAQRHLVDGTVDVDSVLDGAVAELGTAVGELRQIAHGLRPSCLDDGLPAALASLTQGIPLPVTVELETGALPDHVSTTAYYVASEALANAVKHAEAGAIDLVVRQHDDSVAVLVTDDGRGGAVVKAGSGLAGLRDRVAALGGSIGVTSPPGQGTRIEAVLPCGS
ncbi:sensor histidine kinase [Nocardioides speluncae]|uniref:sensor histidine kinase n=1 Tax=Nocardioides speluncae TaxID=2670337 RepID=UPI000D68BA01|nr:histidine kinase [Nocardioides speluncae]